MNCIHCRARPTIKAHLIPQAFALEVRGNDTDHVILSKDGNFKPTKNGVFDRDILCAKCDGKLGENENFAFNALKSIRLLSRDKINQRFEILEFDTDRFLRFCAGIIWKYSITKKSLGRIEIGNYQQILEEISFSNLDIGPECDAFCVKLHTGDDEVYQYRAPLTDRYGGINFVRFSLGGFVVFFKIDKRNNASALHLDPADWMRGRKSLVSLAVPFNMFEEGFSALSARSENPALDKFLTKVAR